MEVKVERALTSLLPSSLLYTQSVPCILGGDLREASAPGLWTKYGRWNAEGTKVFNREGNVIYELSD